MTKKFLFGTLAIALVLGMVFTGCEDTDENNFENNTVNLTSTEEKNTILLTLKGATWKDPTLNIGDPASAAKQKALQEALLNLLEWDQQSGKIDKLDATRITYKFSLEKENVIKITFSKLSAFGAGFFGSGKVTLKKSSSADLTDSLKLVTEDMALTDVWTIGKNNPVTITIPEK